MSSEPAASKKRNSLTLAHRAWISTFASATEALVTFGTAEDAKANRRRLPAVSERSRTAALSNGMPVTSSSWQAVQRPPHCDRAEVIPETYALSTTLRLF